MRSVITSFIVCLLLIGVLLSGCGGPSSTAEVTVLSVAEGSVCVIRGGTGDCVPVQPGMSLEPGDIIKTDDDSGAEITFFDGTIVELEAGTEIELVLLSYNAQADSTTIRLGQTIGSIIFRVTKIIDPGSSYDVETPTGEASVRGSVMKVEVAEDGTTLITNLGGEILASAQGVDVQIPEGRQAIIRPEEAPELIPEHEEVIFADANLEAAVREAIEKEEGPIYAHEVAGLTLLNADGRSISDLSGLEYATGLTELYLWNNEISDISSLAGLTGLTHLNLYGNSIADILPLAGLTGLERLYLNTNQISAISALADLTNLTYLNLGTNNIDDVSTLEGLVGLTELYLGLNQIEDASPLEALVSLKRLNLSNNLIEDISELAGLTELERLYLSNNQIVDISSLGGMTKLTHLSLGTNQIVDIPALEFLTSLEWLYLRSNLIVDIEPLVGNAGLGEGDEVDLRDNELDEDSLTGHVETLIGRGVTVHHDDY